MENNLLQEKSIPAEGSRGKICYFANRRHSGRPLAIFLHGLSANHTTWLSAAELLDKHRINSLLVELRGHGHSDKTRRRPLYRWPVFRDDLARIIEAEGLDDFILVGYSFGGVIALSYALESKLRKPRALVLISTNHTNPFNYWRVGFLSVPARALVNSLAWLFIWQKKKDYYYYAVGKSGGYWHSVRQGLATMPWSVNLWMLGQMGAFDFRGQLGSYDRPVLLVHNPGDPFVTQKEVNDMLAAWPQAQLAEAGHNSHFIASEAQEETANIILDFIKKIFSKDKEL